MGMWNDITIIGSTPHLAGESRSEKYGMMLWLVVYERKVDD